MNFLRWFCMDTDRVYQFAPSHCKRRLAEHQHRYCGWYDLRPSVLDPEAAS